jgi:alkylglycerol monooxygenase
VPGTFAAEQRDDKVVFGLTHPLNSWDVLYTQFLHVAHIGRMVCATPGLANKFFHIVNGPGWMPGLPRLGRIEDIPDVSTPNSNRDLNLVKVLTLTLV